MTLINADTTIKGESLSLINLMKDKFYIPDNQRDYTWNIKVVTQLLDDIKNNYMNNTISDTLKSENCQSYFMGAIVTVKNENKDFFEVQDGQQRIVTFSIIIFLLMYLIKKSKLEDAQKEGFVSKLQQSVLDFEEDKWQLKIKFNDDSFNEFFYKSLHGLKTDEEREAYWNSLQLSKKTQKYLLMEAVKTCSEFLNFFLINNNRIHAFYRVLTETIIFLKINTNDHSQAYKLFESLNNRGVKLSQADLIKNEVISKAMNENDKKDIVEKWKYIKSQIEETEFISLPDLIHLSYLSRHGVIKAEKLYEGIKDLLNNKSSIEYMNELYVDTDILDQITINLSASWTDETHKMLKDIKDVLKIKMVFPFLFSIYRRFNSDKNNFKKYIQFSMNFIFRFMKLSGGTPEKLAEIMSQCSLYMNNNEVGLISGLLKSEASNENFNKAFETYSVNNTKLAYFTVYYIEKYLMKDLGTYPLEHGKQQNLEHIMPATPNTDDWEEAEILKRDNYDSFMDYKWRIGNLIPLPEKINKSLKNKNIDEKLNGNNGNNYNSSNLISPKNIRKYLHNGKWVQKSIEERQKEISKDVSKVWPLE